MKSVIGLLVLVVLGFSVQAQFLNAVGSGNNVLREVQYKSVEGSPYLYEDFKNGAIRDKKGTLSENLLIRYDGYRDEVQFLRDGKTLVVEPALASEFYFLVLNAETKLVEQMTFKNGFTIEGSTALSYFQVIYEGKIKFLRRLKVNYLEENVNNYGTNEIKKSFQRAQTEYLLIDGKAIEIAKGRKDLLQKLGDNSALKTFVKENKLSIKSDNDLIKILKRAEEL